MIFNETQGDVFELMPEYTLVHCISRDCALGAGIALEVEKRFNIKSRLKNTQHKQCPDVIYTETEHGGIANLITKERYFMKPTYNDLKRALYLLKIYCKASGTKKLAMPRIGCGLDDLYWANVSAMIKEVFENTDIEIQVRYL